VTGDRSMTAGPADDEDLPVVGDPPDGDSADAVFDDDGVDELPPAFEQPCANHPGRMTMVTCSACGKPLCPDCMVFAAVGVKCRECARMPRASRVTLKSHRLLAAAAAGLGAGTAVGFAYYYILGAGGFFFLIFFIAAGIGWLVGEAVIRASGHYRGVKTAAIAAGSTVWAFVFPPLLLATVTSGGFSWHAVIFSVAGRGIINWVVMAIAAFYAWRRNR
jgi:hypothetical protein